MILINWLYCFLCSWSCRATPLNMKLGWRYQKRCGYSFNLQILYLFFVCCCSSHRLIHTSSLEGQERKWIIKPNENRRQWKVYKNTVILSRLLNKHVNPQSLSKLTSVNNGTKQWTWNLKVPAQNKHSYYYFRHKENNAATVYRLARLQMIVLLLASLGWEPVNNPFRILMRNCKATVLCSCLQAKTKTESMPMTSYCCVYIWSAAFKIISNKNKTIVNFIKYSKKKHIVEHFMKILF